MTTAIRIENLCKRYSLGAGNSASYRTLGETIMQAVTAPWRYAQRLRDKPSPASDGNGGPASPTSHWALHDVSFEVSHGDVLGIIGRNGAGKSTLLKILSRVTDPTSGRLEYRGRIASLLEVGVGFHPELTGRENIYLNAVLLGMRRQEIQRNFDEIVAFSEIDVFLDTPVKRYSSGMYVRLAFAVAAHMEPDILIVDEVLAVGDVQFQKKCLGKLQEVTRRGRTVLFVSHNMDAIERLCNRVLVLERGRLVDYGETPHILAQYLSVGRERGQPGQWHDLTGTPRRGGTGEARFAAVRYQSRNPQVDRNPYSEGELEVELLIESDTPRTVESLAVILYDRSGTKLVNMDSISLDRSFGLKSGRNRMRFVLKQLHLNPGSYVLGLWLAGRAPSVLDYIDTAVEIEVRQHPDRAAYRRPTSDGVVTNVFEVLEASC